MSQHSYNIANNSGQAVRNDINNALGAIATHNSGATEPTTMFAYMTWADTTAGLLKIRNSANTAWIEVGSLSLKNLGLPAADDLPRWAGSAGGTANALTLTPAQPITAYVNQSFIFKATATNTGAATVNISGLGVKSLVAKDGAALTAGEIVNGIVYFITYDGTNFVAHGLGTVEDGAITRAKLSTGAVAMVNSAAKTANYTVTTSDDHLEGDASGGSFTFTLPAAAAGNKGMTVDFLRTDQTLANAITVTDGGTFTKKLATQGEMLTARSNGTAWKVLRRFVPSEWVAYSPSFTAFGTPSAVAFMWKRSGDTLEISGIFTAGTQNSSTAAFTLPAGLSIDSAKMTSFRHRGSYLAQSPGGRTDKGGGILATPGATDLNFGALETFGGTPATLPLTVKTGNAICISGDLISVAASIPITGWEG